MENAQAQKKFIFNFNLKTCTKNHLRHGRRNEDNIKTDVKVWRDCGLDWTGSAWSPAKFRIRCKEGNFWPLRNCRLVKEISSVRSRNITRMRFVTW